ncbi:hypothetical protein HG535_0A00420 [Zygotorulaspora mrakii]|uniref:non-specific serine/threonine protein kinase n=1 Tax=Zygotorulaspora mrakii TaxID=42260 RepID=A0A7H9AVC5_ZYGMR|nr:uncharacterized protein HG535_0A00420 [Zygotorulaspora mrakii]QLG70103.1 hypothetical protein HG535_0A00420 [Zygotorulaspora mrakii]
MTISKTFLRPSEIYEIKKCVGRGNFGDVYKALDKASGKIVAVKVVNLEHTDEDIDLLAQEIFFLAELRCPFITNYITTMTEDVSMWIIMEYCGGGSCADLLKNLYINGMPEDKVSYITREMLKGLAYLHQQKKIHRDIKAANILITDEGKIKLGDFGVSGQIKATLKRGTFVGTPFWMAPEVVSKNSDGYTEKVDIWSLGITVYELLKGSPPLAKCDPMKVMLNLPKRKPPALHGNYTNAAKGFIAACLVKDPNSRPSATQLLDLEFVKTSKIDDIRNDVNYIKNKKSKENYQRNPKFSLQEKLYDGSGPHIIWDFESQREILKMNLQKMNLPFTPLDVETPQSKSSTTGSPISSKIHSPVHQNNMTDTPITNPGGSSFRNYNKLEYDIGSPMEIDFELQSDGDELKLRGFDYLKNLVSFSFHRMYERAHDDETRMYVKDMLERFAITESKIPGFSEVFVEEMSLRLDSIKKYLAK